MVGIPVGELKRTESQYFLRKKQIFIISKEPFDGRYSHHEFLGLALFHDLTIHSSLIDQSQTVQPPIGRFPHYQLDI